MHSPLGEEFRCLTTLRNFSCFQYKPVMHQEILGYV